jgi:hypothetical protein
MCFVVQSRGQGFAKPLLRGWLDKFADDDLAAFVVIFLVGCRLSCVTMELNCEFSALFDAPVGTMVDC